MSDIGDRTGAHRAAGSSARRSQPRVGVELGELPLLPAHPNDSHRRSRGRSIRRDRFAAASERSRRRGRKCNCPRRRGPMRRASACRTRHRSEYRRLPSSERAQPRPRPIASAPAAFLPRARSLASTTFRVGRPAGEDCRHVWSEFGQCFVASLNTSTTLSAAL